ncbi:MAG TPA: sigma-54-dependent Fis family transcriptional regulator [Micavibrio sp.]|nr:sigma-54-dependent Fis family transcriptional regulator [Micavibrio sp.]
MTRILLIEDDRSIAALYIGALEKDGYHVTLCASGADALAALQDAAPHMALLDIKLPDMDGLTVMDYLARHHPCLPVIVITGHGSVNTAVDAMRRGADDFLVKPFSTERLLSAVAGTLAKDRDETVPRAIAGLTGHAEHKPAQRQSFGDFIGGSAVMRSVFSQIENAARSDATVFITGESGTGKEICAEAIHKHSKRALKPFIPINCAAIPRDLMESELFGHVKGAFTGAITDRHGAAHMANGGTLFLDEIAEMNRDMQSKLLRFLQSLSFQKVGGSKIETTDIRIICATNKNPLDEIDSGQFREDLFYRLHVLPVYMPPLKDRGDDVIDIAMAFLQRFTREEQKNFVSFDEEAERRLRSYDWPGNIRQLQNVIRNVVVMHEGDIVSVHMLPGGLLHGKNSTIPLIPSKTTSFEIKPLAQAEREIIESAIRACDGNIPQAAAALEVSPSTIYRKKASWDASDSAK